MLFLSRWFFRTRCSFSTLIPQILLIGRPGLTQIDKKSRRMRTDCGCSVVVANEGDCTLMPRILLIGRPGLTQID